MSAGQGNPLPGQVRSILPAVGRTYWNLSLWGPCLEWVLSNKEGFENVREFLWEKLVGRRKGFEGAKTNSQECKIFLSWGNRIRWFEAETGQRAGKERKKGFQKSDRPVENRVKPIEDH